MATKKDETSIEQPQAKEAGTFAEYNDTRYEVIFKSEPKTSIRRAFEKKLGEKDFSTSTPLQFRSTCANLAASLGAGMIELKAK